MNSSERIKCLNKAANYFTKFTLGLYILVIFGSNKLTMTVDSSQLKSNFEYEKYSNGGEGSHLHTNFKIPTLENLFRVVTYWDINNSSSPCTYSGNKRNQLCHKVITFDQEGYEKSLQDTRNLILSRLNLNEEPHIKINRNTMNFLDQLENGIIREDTKKKHSTIKTKYDMKSPQNKVFNSMHETSG
jgi:hypothetical protein